ncbi:GNAT family N-acetyltransferase [Rubrivirga sp. IMCC45206]|uniref:GNAT family N-acetyltransferase n=1 Tax=Rubrivirga sp. IMCC45206 TaxID=3391614 RepID=UPI00398FE5CC
MIIGPVSRDVWWAVAEACPYATFFHSPLWAELAEAAGLAEESCTVGMVGTNGTDYVLPTVRVPGALREYRSTARSNYGGIVANGPVDPADVDALYAHSFSGPLGTHLVTGNPLWVTLDRSPAPDSDWGRATQGSTHILSLPDTSDGLIPGFSKGHKSSLKKGVKMGVTCRKADCIQDFQSYYQAYQASLVRWGDKATSQYEWSLFEAVFKMATSHPEHVQLWLAERDGVLASGALMFYWNDHAVWWHGAAHEDQFECYPNNVLIPHLMKLCIEREIKYFDFNPSGGHEGVARFKGRFGAEIWPFQLYWQEGIATKVVSEAKGVARRLLGR